MIPFSMLGCPKLRKTEDTYPVFCVQNHVWFHLLTLWDAQHDWRAIRCFQRSGLFSASPKYSAFWYFHINGGSAGGRGESGACAESSPASCACVDQSREPQTAGCHSIFRWKRGYSKRKQAVVSVAAPAPITSPPAFSWPHGGCHNMNN